jgi:uncharacterized membrane protein
MKAQVKVLLLNTKKVMILILSRLGCQIQLNKEHDGLIVHLLDNYKI